MASYSIKTGGSGKAGSAQKLPNIGAEAHVHPTTANTQAAGQLKMKGAVQGTSATKKSLG